LFVERLTRQIPDLIRRVALEARTIGQVRVGRRDRWPGVALWRWRWRWRHDRGSVLPLRDRAHVVHAQTD
jgi:hypothetical protein